MRDLMFLNWNTARSYTLSLSIFYLDNETVVVFFWSNIKLQTMGIQTNSFKVIILPHHASMQFFCVIVIIFILRANDNNCGLYIGLVCRNISMLFTLVLFNILNCILNHQSLKLLNRLDMQYL